MNPYKLRRLIINIILIASTVIAITITAVSYKNREWSTMAAAMSVITAVLAIWSSLNLTWKQEDEKQPQVIVFIDNDSHKHAFSLVVKNVGGSPAYNVRLNWIEPVYDYDKKAPRFTDFEEAFDFVFLLNGTQHSRLLIGSDDFRQLCEEAQKPLVYQVEVTYSLNPKGTYRVQQTIYVSLEPFRKSINVLNDQMDFYFENKKVGAHLKSISETLKELNKKLQNNE